MNKPWTDIREMLDEAAVQIEPTSFTLDGRALRDLLTDADALLEVARAVTATKTDSTDGFVFEKLGNPLIDDAMAALPKHLRV